MSTSASPDKVYRGWVAVRKPVGNSQIVYSKLMWYSKPYTTPGPAKAWVTRFRKDASRAGRAGSLILNSGCQVATEWAELED